MPMKTCSRCGSELEQSIQWAHWQFCPVCEPVHTAWNHKLTRMLHLAAIGQSYAADKRGQPTRGGQLG